MHFHLTPLPAFPPPIPPLIHLTLNPASQQLGSFCYLRLIIILIKLNCLKHFGSRCCWILGAVWGEMGRSVARGNAVQGNISPYPYPHLCMWADYGAVCRFWLIGKSTANMWLRQSVLVLGLVVAYPRVLRRF